MNEKRTSLVTLLCWLALGIGGLIVVIFLCALVYENFIKQPEQIVQPFVDYNQQQVVDGNNNQSITTPNIEYKDSNNNVSKIATVTSHMNYMQGYNDGTFNPMGGISRAEVATILARLDNKFDENRVYYKGQYSDVSESAWYANYVGYCDIQLIMQGYEDGTFNPSLKMKKSEFLAAIVRYIEADYNGYTSKYDDVKGTWFENYVGYLEAKGYISGKTSTTLGAQDLITRAEVCNVINNALNRKPNKSKVDVTQTKKYFTDVPTTSWYYYDVIEATTFHDIDLYH